MMDRRVFGRGIAMAKTIRSAPAIRCRRIGHQKQDAGVNPYAVGTIPAAGREDPVGIGQADMVALGERVLYARDGAGTRRRNRRHVDAPAPRNTGARKLPRRRRVGATRVGAR